MYPVTRVCDGESTRCCKRIGLAASRRGVSGSGFSDRIGTIAPHARVRLVVRPQGESGLHMQFNVDGKAVSFGPDGYFEGSGGSLITATVSRDFAVNVKSEATLY